MKLIYNNVLNQIVEYCLLPLITYFKPYQTTNYTDVVEDYLKERDTIRLHLQTFRDRIDQYYLKVNDDGLLRHLIDFSKNYLSIDEFYQDLENLSEDKILEGIYYLLQDEKATKDAITTELLISLISEKIEKDDEKWRFTQAIFNPKKLITGLVTLMRDISQWYDPYYKKYEVARQQFRENYTFEQLQQELQTIVDFTPLSKIELNCAYAILSPTFLMAMFHNGASDMPLLCISPTILDILEQQQTTLRDEDMFEILKHLSDSTRYQIFKLLIQNKFKATEIASQLNITRAAVSYHISLLSNSGLILFQPKTNHEPIKYHINKERIHLLFDKIKNDFNI